MFTVNIHLKRDTKIKHGSKFRWQSWEMFRDKNTTCIRKYLKEAMQQYRGVFYPAIMKLYLYMCRNADSRQTCIHTDYKCWDIFLFWNYLQNDSKLLLGCFSNCGGQKIPKSAQIKINYCYTFIIIVSHYILIIHFTV